MPRTKARIIGLGSYLPKNVLTNQDLEKLVDTSHDWIVSRTGMHQRRIAHGKEFASDMGAKAAILALKEAQVPADQIDLVLVATMSPDFISPSTSALIQAHIGAKNAAAMDVQAACSGFLYGLSMAKAYIDAGIYRHILLIATEKMSAFVDYTDRNTCVLFGDGASAAFISDRGKGLAIDSVRLGADGTLSELLMIPAGGGRHPSSQETVNQGMHYIKMEGKELFKHAVRRMGQAAAECLKDSKLQSDDISWVVPHQANERIIDALAKNLNQPLEKVFKTVHKYGNTSASSIAIALHELTLEQPLKAGMHILLVAFGAGLTWGASLLTKRSR